MQYLIELLDEEIPSVLIDSVGCNTLQSKAFTQFQ